MREVLNFSKFRQFQDYLMIQNVYVGDVYIKYGFALEKGIRIKKK